MLKLIFQATMICQAIISGINWRINFGTVSMVRIQVNVFLSGPIQNQSTMEANKRYHMFKFLRKVLSGL